MHPVLHVHVLILSERACRCRLTSSKALATSSWRRLWRSWASRALWAMRWATLASLHQMCAVHDLDGGALFQAKRLMANLYKMFIATDATLIEVNPLAETPDGRGTL